PAFGTGTENLFAFVGRLAYGATWPQRIRRLIMKQVLELVGDDPEVVAEHEQSEEHDGEHDPEREGPCHALRPAPVGDEEVERRKQASDDEHQEQNDQDLQADQDLRAAPRSRRGGALRGVRSVNEPVTGTPQAYT